jgi:hypothetical protein
MSPRPRHRATRPAAAPNYQLKVTLAGIKPPIWRRISVRSDLPLDRLHTVFQKAMGWQTSHLHEWLVGDRRYGEPEPDEPHYEVEDESQMTLREATPIEDAHFKYVYDLGDGWIHDVLVEKISPPDPTVLLPRCLAGERACPPEDCGGVPGYANFLEAIRNPSHPEHRDLLAWAGGRFDPEAFNLAAVNRKLRRVK